MMEIPDVGGDEASADAELRLREWEPETFRSPFALQLFFFLGLKTDMPN